LTDEIQKESKGLYLTVDVELFYRWSAKKALGLVREEFCEKT
jgi:hypothetical protein